MKGLLFFLVGCIIWSCSTTKQLHQPVTKGLIPVKDSKIYYEAIGQGEPIVLLHAGFLDHTMWQSQVEALRSKYRVITLDMPAHGLSERGKDTLLIADALAIYWIA